MYVAFDIKKRIYCVPRLTIINWHSRRPRMIHLQKTSVSDGNLLRSQNKDQVLKLLMSKQSDSICFLRQSYNRDKEEQISLQKYVNMLQIS
jgi:hypothetical protein